MADASLQQLRTRFGRLLAAQRKRLGWTQDELAARADLSVDMVSRLESGTTGARFTTIDRLATALGVDPAELFTPHIPASALERPSFTIISARLASLSDRDLDWLDSVLDAVLKHR